MDYTTADSTSPWQASFEPCLSPIASYLQQDYLLGHSYSSQPFTSFPPSSSQNFVDTELDTNPLYQQLADSDLHTAFNIDHGYSPWFNEFPQDMYGYDQATIHYPYTISDGSSSATTSIPSTPITQQISKDVRCYEIEDTDFMSTLPPYDSKSSSLPHLNNSDPLFMGPEFKTRGDTATINPQNLHPKPPLPSFGSSPLIRPISPSTSPSPSPPLPSPLISPNARHLQSPSSFEETLKTELLRRNQADQYISRLRRGTAQSRAQADENTKRLDWAKDMLLCFPSESAQIPPARAPSPEAWNILKEQTQMQKGLFK